MPKDRDYDDKRDEPTKRLNEDYDSPFSAPGNSKQRLPKDYPTKDEEPDSQEFYDEGDDDASIDNPPGGERGSGPRPGKVA